MEQYKFSKEEPPIWHVLRARFNDPPWEEADTVVTWDGVIYSRGMISQETLVHEREHIRQQREYKKDLDHFLERYCFDWTFRQRIEAEAFRAQYKFLAKELSAGEAQDVLWRLGAQLANEYDLNISESTARFLISS